MNWYLAVLKQYAVFNGRARRKEYWFFVLFNILISIAITMIEVMIGMGGTEAGPGMLSILYALAILIPGLAVTIRRLHDTDRTGWWVLIGLIPVIGAIVLLVFMLLDGTPGDNKYGANPKASGVMT